MKSCIIKIYSSFFIDELIRLSNTSMVLNNSKITEQNSKYISVLISTRCQIDNIILNFEVLNNDILSYNFFYFETQALLIENITFIGNTLLYESLSSIFIVKPSKCSNNGNVFKINNILFKENSFPIELFRINEFNLLEASNLNFEQNFYLFGFNIQKCTNIFIYNISFINNNNIQSFANDSLIYKDLKNKTTQFKIYGICIDIIFSNSINVSFAYFNKNYGRGGSTIFGINFCKTIYLKESHFVENIVSTIFMEGSSGFYFYSLEKDIIHLDNIYCFRNQLISNYSEAVGDYIMSGCGSITSLYGNVTIYKSSFYENKGYLKLCLNLKARYMKLNGLYFLNNSHTYTLADATNIKFEKIGVLSVDFSILIINDCNFTINTAVKGPALSIQPSFYPEQILYGKNNNFIKNFALISGNAIFLYSSKTNRIFVIDSCFFTKGISQTQSGVFYFGSQNGEFIQNFTCNLCFFIENEANSSAILEYLPTYPINFFVYFIKSFFYANKKYTNNIQQGGLFDIWGEVFDQTYSFFLKYCIIKGNNYIFFQIFLKF